MNLKRKSHKHERYKILALSIMRSLFLIFILKLTCIALQAQTIELSTLISFHSAQNPSAVNEMLTESNQWTCNRTRFDDPQGFYQWTKVPRNEEYDSGTKDQIAQILGFPTFGAVLLYSTVSRQTFDQIKEQLQSQFTNGGVLVQNAENKTEKFYNDTVVVEVNEPLQPQANGLFMFGIAIYFKQDYDKGFKIR